MTIDVPNPDMLRSLPHVYGQGCFPLWEITVRLSILFQFLALHKKTTTRHMFRLAAN